MALCLYSSGLAMDGYTVIENTFFNEFLPQSTGDDVKVYLYGLNLCSNPNAADNDLGSLCRVLCISEEDAIKSFEYWEEMGLVQIVSRDPLEIRFLPIRIYSGSAKLRKPEKWTEFNKTIASIISGRDVTPVELNHYYTFVETEHFEPEAIILIASHCVKYKSNTIGYPYILQTIRNFKADGYMTYEAVEAAIVEQEKAGAEIKQVLNALGLKRNADLDERNLYVKWTQKFGFTHGVIMQIAKLQNKRGGFAKLDTVLTKYYEQKLFSMEDIALFSEKQDEMFEIAKEVSKVIGVYYGNYESVVNTYILDWMNKGYEKDALLFVACYCFKQSLRTLEGMNVVIQKFFKLGLVSLESIKQYIESIIKNDEQIREVLETLGLLRTISSNDRDLYKNWVFNWGFVHEQILLVAKLIKDRSNQTTYLSRVLSDLHEKHIEKDDEIKNYLKNYQGSKPSETSKKPDYLTRELSKEQLSAVLDSLEDIEI